MPIGLQRTNREVLRILNQRPWLGNRPVPSSRHVIKTARSQAVSQQDNGRDARYRACQPDRTPEHFALPAKAARRTVAGYKSAPGLDHAPLPPVRCEPALISSKPRAGYEAIGAPRRGRQGSRHPPQIGWAETAIRRAKVVQWPGRSATDGDRWLSMKQTANRGGLTCRP